MKEEWKSTLRTYEQSMQYTACLVATRSSDAQELQDQLVMLRKAAFYTRYGDIFAEACTKLKTQAEAKKRSMDEHTRSVQHIWRFPMPATMSD